MIPERRVLGLLLIGALLLTQIEFPANYWTFIDLSRGAVLIVIERDAVLALAFAVSLWHLWRLPDVEQVSGED